MGGIDISDLSLCGLSVVKLALAGGLGACVMLSAASLRAEVAQLTPITLRTDALLEPLGIDDPKPLLAWRLTDSRNGARQIAYRITVYRENPELVPKARPLWDSQRVASAVSTGVAYGGPTLSPSTRYYWRVQVWGAAGDPYPVSAPTYWETGLMSAAAWQAKWIGYEEPELHAIRESGAIWITHSSGEASVPADADNDFRLSFSLSKPVQRAVLYVTGQDTAAAWINGHPVLESAPLNKWKQMPWGTYAHRDVTAAVRSGTNSLAIRVIRYLLPSQKSVPAQSPMSTCLYVVFADGSTKLLSSLSEGWRAELNAPPGWWQDAYDDVGWKAAIAYASGSPSFGGATGLPWPTGPVAALRHAFEIKQQVVSARLYATALGAYKLYVNGQEVGDQILAPGWTDYRERVTYQVYDITPRIERGTNAIGAYLAPGWYSTPLRWFRQGNNYGAAQPALRAQLRLEYADGTVEWIATDESWKAEPSAILQAEIYDGETRDARLEQDGWDTARFDDAKWHAAVLVHPSEPIIVAQYFPPIRYEQLLTAKSINQPTRGVYILDFGQNMSAVPVLHTSGSPGDVVRLRFAEVLNEDGTLYTDNLRTAKATDRFTLAGRPGTIEEFKPLFTFHGYRYAEITGLRKPPTLDTLKAAVLHTDAPFTSRLETGDSMVNQLWSNILWGQRSNFVGVPTDCPQRDERLGWSADAQVFWRTATYNMDLTTFSRKYAADLHGTQLDTPYYGIFAPGVDTANAGFAAAWSDAGIIIPWTGWIQTGSTQIIEDNWTGMEEYLAAIEHNNPDHLWRKSFGIPFGDWLTPTITTPEDLIATAYWAYDALLMKQMAVATHRTEQVTKYSDLFSGIRDAFQKAYLHPGAIVGAVDNYPSIPPPTIHPEEGTVDKARIVETQTGYVLALHMDLIPKEVRAEASDRLVEKIKANQWLLGTGFLGTPYLLEVLSDTGHSDLAYRLLLNREYPSWGYLIDHGATTTWERWNGDKMRDDPSMNSYNHYAYGAVAEWIYRYAAGVDTVPDAAGFRTIYLHPNFDQRLGHLDFDYDSPYGTIRSHWAVEGATAKWTVTIPPNTTALLPVDRTNARAFRLDGVALEVSPRVHPGAKHMFTLAAGTYVLTATLKQPATKY